MPSPMPGVKAGSSSFLVEVLKNDSPWVVVVEVERSGVKAPGEGDRDLPGVWKMGASKPVEPMNERYLSFGGVDGDVIVMMRGIALVPTMPMSRLV